MQIFKLSSNMGMDRITTAAKAAQIDDDRPLLMQFNNKLYDIRGFAAKHPGGRKVLEKVAGSSIDKFMNGEERILGVKHEHSKAAFEILERYSLDSTFKVGIFLRGEA